jgi:CBS domain-containing protein
MALSRLKPGRVATVEPSCIVAEAARRMSMFSVGALVIVETPESGPVGIVTDRDLVKLIGEGLDPKVETVARFARRPLHTAPSKSSPKQCLEKMLEHGVRRIPLLAKDGTLAGISSLDDLLLESGHEFGDIALAIRKQFSREHPLPSAHERSL